jgi:hypothetical protein
MKRFLLLFASLSLISVSSFARVPIWEMPHSIGDLTVDGPTPLFVDQQTYLGAAPLGVDAAAGWKLPGGTGEHVKLVDIEVAYHTDHEDFAKPFYVGNNPVAQDTEGSVEHGTAVWGEIAGENNSLGVTGIAYGIQYGVYGFIEGNQDDVDQPYITGINAAIQGAIDHLSAGDIMVIEQEMSGPDGDTSVDYWPAILAKLK